MDQKYLKLDQEIEKYRKDESNMNRGIHTMEQKLASLNEECSQRRGYKDFLENDNFGAQNQLICDLKASIFIWSNILYWLLLFAVKISYYI